MLELYIHALCHVTLLLPLEKEYISLLLHFELGHSDLPWPMGYERK